jgi:hypothetical protein
VSSAQCVGGAWNVSRSLQACGIDAGTDGAAGDATTDASLDASSD